MIETTRRNMLSGALIASAALPTTLKAATHVVPGPSGRPRRQRFVNAWGSYAFKVGAFECLVVSDGQLDFPAQWYASNADLSAINDLLEANGLPRDICHNQTSGLVVDNGRELLLCETGMAPRFRALAGAPPAWLARTGQIPGNLKAAGIERGDLRAVFISHGHPDHLGWLLQDDGTATFPNARIFYDRRDYEYHVAKGPGVDPQRVAATEVARRVMTAPALKKLIELTAPGQEIVSGVTTVDAPGHTPGHCGLLIRSGSDALFHGGDLLAHYVLTMAHPEWSFFATVDKPMEIASRNRLFAMAADERLRTFFCHAPFPNLGRVQRAAGAYRWLPEYFTWQPEYQGPAKLDVPSGSVG